MFNFLKEKIKNALSAFSKKAEEELKEEKRSEDLPDKKKEHIFDNVKERFGEGRILEPAIEKKEIEEAEKITEEIIREIPVEEKKDKVEEKIECVVKKLKEKKDKGVSEEILKEGAKLEEEVKKEGLKEKEEIEEKKGFFEKIKEKITTTRIDRERFDELFWNLELVLLENNVAVEVVEKIKEDLKKEIVDLPILRGKIEEIIFEALKKSITGLFNESAEDVIELAQKKKPFVVCFVGINGSGKTTTIAKMAKLFQENNLSVVLAASDTFRAAAIEQLEIYANNLGVKLIKHDYGADEAAVAFDAIQHAKAKNKDVVLIDTAGRLHSNHNLIEEMKKIIKVAKPDLKIFIGESITGNDCVEQAQKFNEAIDIDGIILSKADIDEKGGAALSVSYITGKPILYLGIGQNYSDLEKFSKEKMIKRLGL